MIKRFFCKVIILVVLDTVIANSFKLSNKFPNIVKLDGTFTERIYKQKKNIESCEKSKETLFCVSH